VDRHELRSEEMKVHTIKGLIDRDRLDVKDIVTEEETCRVIATEWYHGDELVRRDVWVSLLTGQAVGVEQAELV
jgi:hypothetical protein